MKRNYILLLQGYEHEPPGPTECCGKCVQVACILNGTLHPIGSSWNPDPCTFYSCVGSRGHVSSCRIKLHTLSRTNFYIMLMIFIPCYLLTGSCNRVTSFVLSHRRLPREKSSQETGRMLSYLQCH